MFTTTHSVNGVMSNLVDQILFSTLSTNFTWGGEIFIQIKAGHECVMFCLLFLASYFEWCAFIHVTRPVFWNSIVLIVVIQNVCERTRAWDEADALWNNTYHSPHFVLSVSALSKGSLTHWPWYCMWTCVAAAVHIVTHCPYVCNRCALETWGATQQATSSPGLSLLTWQSKALYLQICQLLRCTRAF